jgi:hypothetical protein
MVRDVVGLYLSPSDKAVALCVDEKSQVQALDRTAPILPIMPGLAPRGARLAGAEPADHAALHLTSGSWLNLVEIFFSLITRQPFAAAASASLRSSSPP